jgi:hypothetical protein
MRVVSLPSLLESRVEPLWKGETLKGKNVQVQVQVQVQTQLVSATVDKIRFSEPSLLLYEELTAVSK